MVSEPKPGREQLPFQANYDKVTGDRDDILLFLGTPALDYFDAGIMRQIMKPDGAFDTGTEMYTQLSGVLSQGEEASDVDLAVAGLDLGSHILRDNPTNPRTIITRYLNACFELDRVKLGETGFDGTTATEIAMLDYTRKMVVERLPDDKKTKDLFEAVGYAIARSEDNDPETDHHAYYKWLKGKYHILHLEFLRLHAFRNQLATAYGDFEAPESIHGAEASGLARSLTLEAMRHRKYGVKPAYTDASIGGSWMFYDGIDYERALGKDSPMHRQRDYAAIVFHSPKSRHNSLKIEFDDMLKDGNAHISKLSGALAEAKVDMAFYIQFDGSITYDKEGMTPISNVLHDQPAVLEALEAELSANFFDLTMPIYSWSRPKSPPGFKELHEKGQAVDPILDLVVPRVRYLDELRQAGTAVEDDEPVRIVRDHYITWHVRTLPEGWSASPEAIQLAKQYRVDLAPNETFVREHKPAEAQENPILGHKIVRRTGVVDSMFEHPGRS